MMNFSAIIYDMDGVLIDSEPLWQEAEKKVFAVYGLHLTTLDCLKTKGMRIDEVVHFWYQQHPWEDFNPTQTVEDILDQLIALIQTSGVAMTGVLESIQYFKKQNLPLAIATSSPIRVMNAVLSKLDIIEHFEVLCSAEMEAYGKPHPAVYLTTAKKLQVRPEQCLVIEDSISGMIAAKAAKMKVIAIPEVIELDKPEWCLADYKLASLHEISSIPKLIT